MKGKLIVFEGTDGSGKSTQFRLLCDLLQTTGNSFHRLVFPQYQEPSSALLKMYLNGEFGSRPSDVNPYAASSFYAVDRYASWKRSGSLSMSRGPSSSPTGTLPPTPSTKGASSPLPTSLPFSIGSSTLNTGSWACPSPIW